MNAFLAYLDAKMGLLLAANGSLSMVRFLAFICVVVASAIGLYAVIEGKDLNAAAVLCGVFLGAAFGGKVAQAVVESKNGQ